MAHYSFLDENNIVLEVIVGIDEDNLEELPEGFSSWEEWYGDFEGKTCKRTSYNTQHNEHLLGGTAFRGNYAGVGHTYDPVNDVFYSPQPYPSWTLDQSTWSWIPPVPYPEDDGVSYWEWNEENQTWDLVE